jgi:pimeloyl-ACP methyl ester carboxylesterase
MGETGQLEMLIMRGVVVLVLSLTWSHSSLAQSVRVFEWSHGHSTIAVLFLHGLGGCAVPNGQSAKSACAAGAGDSFRNPAAAESWPQMLASDDWSLTSFTAAPLKVSDFGIWGVDYSRLTVADCPKFSIPEAARLVRTQIETSGLASQYEQFIIIAHSMGGLIAKNLLLQWQNAGDPEGLLARTIGIFLLGVPSQGSPVAPNSPLSRYLTEVLHLDHLANVCGRQVKDIFAGDENTYLADLERSWEALLGTRRRLSNSQAPMIFCAYETKPEPLMGSVFSLTIVERLYTQTQCSDSQFPLPTYHTALPKPLNPNDDVQGWLHASLRMMFRERSQWPFVTYAFLPGDSFASFAAHVNSQQRSFRLDVGEVHRITPAGTRFEAPDEYELVAKVASANKSICMQTDWEPSMTKVRLRPAGDCAR